MILLTPEWLQELYQLPAGLLPEMYAPLLGSMMPQYGIIDRLRVCAFLAQIGHESGRLRFVEELASGEAYEGRKDLGNTEPGDGVKFKGRGLIQITGRANYEKAQRALGIPLLQEPERLIQPYFAVKSACWWWQEHGLNELADTGDFEKVTKKINGGLNGYQDRLNLYEKALSLYEKYS
jgi:putative chitinase